MAKKIKIDKALMERWEERKALVSSVAYTIDCGENKEERITRAQKDYAYFVETYFPHLALCKCGKFQITAANYVLKNRHARSVFEWARGHAKSTHFSLLIPLWLKIQKERTINVMVLVSKSEESAIGLLSDLQAELESNARFIADFGVQVKSGEWSTGEFATADGCLFKALGRGQSPRGLKKKGNRPDYISIDDIDDDIMVLNPKRVGQTTEWAMSALLGAMDMGRGRFVVVGNRIAKDSILTRIAKRPQIYHTQVNALNKDGEPSWSEKYKLSEVQELREFMGERMFQKEYMNNPTTEGAIFSEKYIRFGKMLPLHKYGQLICYTDPSFKNTATADYKATMLVGKTSEGVYHVIGAYADQTSVSNMVAWHYAIDRSVSGAVPIRYYMEANMIQDLLLKEFVDAGNGCGHHIPITPDKRKKGDKFARIEAMQPLFERSLILLNEECMNDQGMQVLVEQLLMFEQGSRTHDDAPDALEGAISLLNNRVAAGTATYRFGARQSQRY